MPNFSRRGTSGGVSRRISGAVSRGIRTAISGVPERTSRGVSDKTSREAPKRYLMSFRRKPQKEVPEEKPKDTSFFGKGRKDEIPRDKLRSILRKSSSRIPGTSRKYYEKDRVGLEKRIGKSAGSYISRQDIKNHIQKLKNERFRSKISTERDKINDEINFWKEHSGIK